MLFRKILDFIFASPVTVVFSVVSVACVSILVVKITSNMAPLSDADGITSDTGNNGVSFQSNDFSSEKTSYKAPISDEQSGGLNSGYQPRSYSPPQTADRSNRINFSANDVIGELTPNSDRSSETVDNIPSTLNFSTGNNLNSESTTSGSTTSSSNDNSSTTTTESIEKDFPSSLEYEVKIDFEETQSISCRPIEADGLPCLCTFTVTDADGSVSQLVDNCG